MSHAESPATLKASIAEIQQEELKPVFATVRPSDMAEAISQNISKRQIHPNVLISARQDVFCSRSREMAAAVDDGGTDWSIARRRSLILSSKRKVSPTSGKTLPIV